MARAPVGSGERQGGDVQHPIKAIRVVLHFDPPLTHTRAICEVLVDTLEPAPADGGAVLSFPQGGGAA